MMKNTGLKIGLWLVVIVFLYAFTRDLNDKANISLEEAVRDADPAGIRYLAVSNGDTALLSMVKKGSAVTGNLQFKFIKGNNTTGIIKGTMKGDTLLGDYHCKAENGKWYRNPVAFLVSGKQLKMGIGQVEVAWGRGYFAKNEPIDYEAGRFVFAETKLPWHCVYLN